MGNRGRHSMYRNHLIVRIVGLEIAKRMMCCQVEDKNPPNLDVFLRCPTAGPGIGGFRWRETTEGFSFWDNVTMNIKAHPLYHEYLRKKTKQFS